MNVAVQALERRKRKREKQHPDPGPGQGAGTTAQGTSCAPKRVLRRKKRRLDSEPGPSAVSEKDECGDEASASAAPAQRQLKPRLGPYPFPANYLDHFETCFEAIRDLAPVLSQLASRYGKPASELRAYDPFFCRGSVASHMSALGFDSFIHNNRDFYSDVQQGTVPDYDILMTNPPYSEEHKERILDYCGKSGKPWALLLPSYVLAKQYFQLTLQNCRLEPFFLAPVTPYELRHPLGTGYEVPLFETFWVIDLGSLLNDSVFQWCTRALPSASVTLCRNISQLKLQGR
eukprot:RCo035391